MPRNYAALAACFLVRSGPLGEWTHEPQTFRMLPGHQEGQDIPQYAVMLAVIPGNRRGRDPADRMQYHIPSFRRSPVRFPEGGVGAQGLWLG
jgi:hypothetical protein